MVETENSKYNIITTITKNKDMNTNTCIHIPLTR